MVGEPGPAAVAADNERRLLIIDDDAPFRDRLARAMEHRGFTVATADAVATGLDRAETFAPNYAVVDLRLGQASGLDLVNGLRKTRPTCRIVMLTGYGNFASAVSAIKAGAVDYIPKPADADAIAVALLEHHNSLPPPPELPMTADRVRWEHIQRVFEQCDRNVSETARRLRMHRRTLQRILGKRAPHN